MKGKEYEPQFINSQTPETGKRTFTGKGRFRFRISSAATWQIKVYD
jgi:hypothetical protein